MSALGDRALGSTVEFCFSTSVNGAPTDLAGSPAVSVYKTGSTTEITAGVTLTAPYDSRTGLANVSIVATSGNGYADGNDYSVVITTGTLGGASVVGTVIGHFSVGLGNLASINDAAGPTNAIPRGTVTSGSSTTSVATSALTIAGAAASGVVANQFANRTILFDGNTTTAGLRGASSAISANTASNTPTLTVGTLPATPASGDTFSII
jgi:hypothetical protein